jgi:hypothetical protein
MFAVGGWQVPSESVAQVGLHCLLLGVSAPIVMHRLRPVSGRLNSASSLAIPFVFLLRWAHCGPRYPEGSFRAIARAAGRPGGPATAPRPSPLWLRASGAAEARQRTWSLGASGCRPPGPVD